jgi:hypothetical protein
LGSVEGHVWRVEPAITPFVVSLVPMPALLSRSHFIAIFMELRDLQILQPVKIQVPAVPSLVPAAAPRSRPES